MNAAYLSLLLSSIFILTIVTATIITHRDHGNCESASSTDRLFVDVIEPKAYEIRFVLRPSYNSLQGSCNISVQVHKQTKRINLHAYEITLLKVELKLVNTTVEITPVNYNYCNISQILSLHFVDDIIPGKYYLTLSLRAQMKRNQLEGIGRHNYMKWMSSQRWLVTNLFQVNMARRMFPCWDQPEIKATFNISIVHPKKYTVLSNMQVAEVSHEVHKQITYFDVTPMIAPSEIVIIMFDNILSKAETQMLHGEEKKIITWNRVQNTPQLQFFYSAVDTVKYSLLKNMLGQLIIPETNHIVLPHSPMKVAGFGRFTIYKEEDVVYNSKLHFPGRKLQILKLLARQQALQWFDQVFVSSPYLRESFATYFSYYFPIEPYYNSHLEELFTVQVLQPMLHYDVSLRMRPILYVNETNAIDKFLYSRLLGYKGAALLRMSEKILTTSTFRRLIMEYAKNVELHPNKRTEFWNILQNTKIKDAHYFNISVIINKWLQQEKFPHLYVSLHSDTLFINACRVELWNAWNIFTTIFIVTSSNKQHISNFWIPCEASRKHNIPDIYFAIVDMHQTGYYRIMYNSVAYMRISSYLQYGDYEQIPVQNRAQLIDDAYYFVLKEDIPPSTLFNLISYLKRETHYVPWYTMFNILTYMSTYLELPWNTYIKPFILESLDGLLKNIGYEERIKDNEMTNSLRLLAARWACKLGHEECLKVATTKLLKELTSSQNKTLPWWRDWTYCMGMKRMEEAAWRSTFMNFYENNDVDTFKYLACTDNEVLVIYYMNELTKDSLIRNIIGPEILREHYRSILKRHLNKNAVFKYVLDNFESIFNRIYGWRNLITLWGDIIFNLNNIQIDEIKVFSKKVPDRFALREKLFDQLIKARLSYINKLSFKLRFI